MTLDFILGGVVAIGLLIYLVYALVRPEEF
jgi:K+-transporting ATPase KdpF subunit